MIALDVLDSKRLDHRLDARACEPQTIGRVVQNAVAARLGFEQKRQGRVAGDADALDRVHLHGDGEGMGVRSEVSQRVGEPRGWGVTGKPPARNEYGVARASSPRPTGMSQLNSGGESGRQRTAVVSAGEICL